MLKRFLNNLLSCKNTVQTEPMESQSVQSVPAPKKEPNFKLGNGLYWEFDEVRNGYGGYKTVNAYLLKMDDPDFRRCIVNCDGEIQNFPGFKDRSWESRLEIPMGSQQVNFVFWIYPYQNGRASVRWLIQPDGRYFADEDGFGMEPYDEIEVYSALDEEGNFTEPFGLR